MSPALRPGFVPALLLLLASSVHAAGVPADCEQLIVALAPDWDSMRGSLQRFERSGGGEWQPVSQPVPVLFGKNGLAWGRGLAGQDEPGLHKAERDGRAPAGIFRIGKIYTYDPALPEGADFPFHQVTKADAWIDDPKSPDYNRFVQIDDPEHPPPWFAKQKMRHHDPAYRWLVEIRHNSDPPLPNEGSAIFFHIRRGAQRPTSGCTTMAESELVRLIKWLRADRHPCYVLLPRETYRKKAAEWGMPASALARRARPADAHRQQASTEQPFPQTYKAKSKKSALVTSSRKLDSFYKRAGLSVVSLNTMKRC